MKLFANSRKLVLTCFLFISVLGFSQERTINLGDFNVLKVFSGMTLELIRSDEQKIVIIGEKRENLTVKNTNGKLKVFLNFPELYNDKDVNIKLYYKDDLDILDANEGAAIFSDQTFNQQNVTIRSQEGAYIHLVLDVKYVTVKAVSGGNIRLRGKVVDQEVEVTTGGVYEGYELDSEIAEVMSASGGKVEIKTSSFLDAKVRFGGKIDYKGNPVKVKTNKIIGGSIINKS
ncbi:MAG: head GIN domain-containing protein [Flavobacteriaceae bacterium]|nr:head GIN domain-containing protein [Flavobacteriaceae bacterium]